MKKITMMDNLTLYVGKGEYKVEIDEKFSKVNNLDEIEDLEKPIPGFFDLDSIGRQNGKIYLIFNLPGDYEPLEKAKYFIPVIKLQLINSLLESDPLTETEGMTYLDLNNVFYSNFNEIKVLYRSNGLLPYHKGASILEQYKLFIMGFYSNKYSYKRFVVNKDTLLQKENIEFLFTINAASTIAEIKSIVESELEKQRSDLYKDLQTVKTKQKRSKMRKIIFSFFGALFLMMLIVGGIKQIEKNVRAELKGEMAATQLENELSLALVGNDYKKAIQIMEDKEDSSFEIASMLVQAGRYNEALQYDDSIENFLVARLYETGQPDRILELESESEFIKFEKKIVDFNNDYLVENSSLIEDKDTLKRLSLAFLKHENFVASLGVLERLATNHEHFSLKEAEIKEIEQYINMVELNIELKSLNEELLVLRTVENLEENEEDSIERSENIKILESKITDLQKELFKIDELIGNDN